MVAGPVRAVHKKKKFILWQSFFLIFIVLLAAYILLQSPIFTISKIIVQGNNKVTAGEIVQVSGIVTGMNIFKADLHTASAKVNVLPMIKGVNIIRNFPDNIIIKVVERVPVALVVVDGKFVELDAEGYYLRAGSAAATGLPVVTGINVQAAGPGKKVKGKELDVALRVVQELGVQLRNSLSEVHVGNVGLITLYTLEGIECQLGMPENVAVKGNYFLQVIKELQAGDKNIEYVDFSIVNSPVVKYKD
ncbi:FtsQ-type POTRA domain-containing protein [Desulfoscipio sp. XC116]|uniref:cell division protein FtsQ/DivIB n=1 Tax=Desulfoscipio sp. XC116 TaxID=3144975 RepID=UPI00325AC5EE